MTAPAIKVLVVVPVYNHLATLRNVVSRALAVHPDVLVVDDGSDDDVTPVVDGLPVQVLRHPVNRGKGAAILTAAAAAAQRGMTHIITLDADGQHDPAEIARFLVCLREAPWSVVVGHRDFRAPNVPRSSKFGRAFGNFWARVQTGQHVRDVQSGFRAYPVCALRELHTWTRRYAFEVEILVRAAWAGFELRSVDIPVVYLPAGQRVSHFRFGRDNLQLALLNTALTLRSIWPWPHPRVSPVDARREAITLWHPLHSLRRLLTENATPVRLALAGGLGVFLGTLPLLGIHTLAILTAAAFLRLNKAAAVATSQLCMPPLVPALCIETGYYLRHGTLLTEVSWEVLGRQALHRLWEWLLGSLLLAPLLAAVVALAIYAVAVGVRRAMAQCY